MKSLVSIIVPVYNCENYVLDCLMSIEEQTYPYFEAIIINDGSTDSTLKICESFCLSHKRFKLITQSNGGVSSARNTGLLNSKGDLIGFVDADDCLDKTFLEKMVFDVNKYDFSISKICIFDNNCNKKRFDETRIADFVKNPPDPRFFLINKQFEVGDNFIRTDSIFGSCCRVLFKKILINANSLLFDSNLKLGEDKLFVMNYMNKTSSGLLVDEYLYFYRSNEKSATSTYCNGYNQNYLSTTFLMHKSEIDFLAKNNSDPNLINYLAATCAMEFVINELKLSHTPTKNKLHVMNENNYKKYFSFSVSKIKKIDKINCRRTFLFLLIKLRCFNILRIYFSFK